MQSSSTDASFRHQLDELNVQIQQELYITRLLNQSSATNKPSRSKSVDSSKFPTSCSTNRRGNITVKNPSSSRGTAAEVPTRTANKLNHRNNLLQT